MRKCLKFKRIWSVIMLVSCMVLIAPQSVFASSTTKNIYGVDVTASTDKDDYEIGENIGLRISAKNNNEFDVYVENAVSNINIDGIEVGEIELPGTLNAGEVATVEKSIKVNAAFEEWKTVNVDGENIKVGIRALSGVVEEGSEFLVQTLPSGTQEYNTYWNQLDDRDKVEHVSFFNLGIRKPNGEIYTTMDNGLVTIYIQIPYNWDESDLQAVYVSAGVDEQFQENFVTIDGIRYLSFRTNHFSPYAVLDLSNDDEKDKPHDTNPKDNEQQATDESKTAYLKTGDYSQRTAVITAVVVLLALAVCLALGKKFRRQMFALILCLGTVSVCTLNFGTNAFADEEYFTVTDSMENVIYVGGKEAVITTTITLRVLKPTFSMDEQVPVKEDLVLTSYNIPTDWSGRYEIVNDSGKVVKSGSFTFSDLINNKYKITNTLDEGAYSITVYDQYGNTLATIDFEVVEYYV